MQPEQTFWEFKKIHRRTPFEWKDEWGVWTRKILEHFCELGDKKHFEIGTNTRYWKEPDEKKKRDEKGSRKIKVYGKWVKVPGEYLVDFCWYKTEPKYCVKLAMEVEWQPWSNYKTLDPDWDFYKLLDIKTPLKIWVSSVNEEERQQQLELLHEILKERTEMRIRGIERYLIVLFPHSETSLWVRGYEGDHKTGLRKEGSWREVGAFKIKK